MIWRLNSHVLFNFPSWARTLLNGETIRLNQSIKSNQIICWFLGRGENRCTRREKIRSRVDNQQTRPTYAAGSGNRTRARHIQGRRALSALLHPCPPRKNLCCKHRNKLNNNNFIDLATLKWRSFVSPIFKRFYIIRLISHCPLCLSKYFCFCCCVTTFLWILRMFTLMKWTAFKTVLRCT